MTRKHNMRMLCVDCVRAREWAKRSAQMRALLVGALGSLCVCVCECERAVSVVRTALRNSLVRAAMAMATAADDGLRIYECTDCVRTEAH